MRFLKQLLLSALLLAVCQMAFAEQMLKLTQPGQSFTPEQTTQIETIVRNYLVANPEVMVQVFNALQKKQEAQMAHKAKQAITSKIKGIFESPTSPVAGNVNGKVTLVEFFDYQCPHCKAMTPTLDALVKANPELRIVYKELPIFPNSDFISKAALASIAQGKYDAFHNALMKANNPVSKNDVLGIAKSVGLNITQLKADMDKPTVSAEINQNQQLAQDLGLAGTPAFIVASNINSPQMKSFFISGQATQNEIQKFINQALKAGGNASSTANQN